MLDAERSIAFYRDGLGLAVASRQVNAGGEQDALDGLQGARVDVVALAPAQATPHVELLAYRAPVGRASPASRPQDIAGTRLVLAVTGLPDAAGAVLRHDPDGHALVLVPA